MKGRGFKVFVLLAIVALVFGITGTAFAASTVQDGQQCAEGQHWDENSQSCVADEEPTALPDSEPDPTVAPTDEPTVEPTAEPTVEPTAEPTQEPEVAKLDVCHKDGQSGNYSLVNVSIHSVDDANGVGGHGNHEDDSWDSFVFDGVTYPGQGDFPGPCGEQEPTNTPVPTPTSTTPPGEPTPTPPAQPHREPKTGPESALPIAEGIAFVLLSGLGVISVRRLLRK